MTDTPPPRALLSVSDKTGLAGLARGLAERGFEPSPEVAQVRAEPHLADEGEVLALEVEHAGSRCAAGAVVVGDHPSHPRSLAIVGKRELIFIQFESGYQW